MSYNNYNQQYDGQGGNYGQQYDNNQYGGQQYGGQQYGGQQYGGQQYGGQQYDNNQYSGQQYNQQYDGQGGNYNQQYDTNQHGGQQQQKHIPQILAYDVDINNFDENTTPEQMALAMLGNDNVMYSNDVKKVKIPEIKARDLEDFKGFSLDSFAQNSEDVDRGLFDSFGGGNGKSKTSHQLLGGAAAWAALNWYQNKSRNQGKKVSHGFAKKLIVAFAAAQAIKHWEKNSSSFQQGLSRGITRDDVIAEATRSASIAADMEMGKDLAANTGYAYDYNSKGGEADSFDGGAGSSGQQQYGGQQNYGGQQQYGGGYDNNSQYGGGYNNSNQYGGGYNNQY
ncbi:hypothetical protein FBU31_003978 [Coemansia sp. 'formosensis']|nr:hypothetical protein FBU31_003978 [Coemansia sp. 'formosensis']